MPVSRRRMQDLNQLDKFTKRHLTVDPMGEDTLVCTRDTAQTVAIAAFLYDREGKVTPDLLAEKAANTERIVDSWNACLSMPSAMLKSPGCIASLYEALRWVSQQVHDGRAITEFEVGYIDSILDRFNPPLTTDPERVEAVVQVLSDLNVSDDTTPMYDIAAVDVVPVEEDNPNLDKSYLTRFSHEYLGQWRAEDTGQTPEKEA